jgi:hypothetical protein
MQQLLSATEPPTLTDRPCSPPRLDLGLRSLSHRTRDTAALCPDCRQGDVVPREIYYAWWLERFSVEECAAMARAICGPGTRVSLERSTLVSYVDSSPPAVTRA